MSTQSKKPPIPSIPLGAPNHELLRTIKMHLDVISGSVGGKIKPLSPTAGVGDIINKINEIIDKLQS